MHTFSAADTITWCAPVPEPPKEMLKNAAKQRIRRMVKPKTKRSDLEVPKWVAEQWNKGTSQKEAMAALLQEVNWDKVGLH